MEDQEIMDQYLENRQQNYVIDNVNAVAGSGGIVADVGSGEILGVKYDEQLQNEEHDVGDDDELKYVKEVQQSEKHQSVKDLGDGSNELAENEEVKYKYEIGNGAMGMGGIQDGENLMSNSNGHETHKVEDELLNDVESPHVGVNVLLSADNFSQEIPSIENTIDQPELGDDEEPSSLATNGTSSISENVSNQNLTEHSVDIVVATELNNDEPIPIEFGSQHTLDMDLEQMQSQLNPDAKEFVPNFGSNPSSPISPLPTDFQNLNTNDTVENNKYFGQTSSAVPRHIITDDDLLAQSPRKGRGDNMDTIALPAEQEFDEEADQRPRELELDDVERSEIDLGKMNTAETPHQTSTDLVSRETQIQCDDDFQTSKTIDHGPETCVDLCADFSSEQFKELPEIGDDIMKQSIYVSNDEHIEDVLNSVQPIPTEIDSTNNSSTEELATADVVGDKELLQVEEKEHISNSPSTEEILMQSTLHSSNPDISFVPVEMSDIAGMQNSFYLEQNEQADTKTCIEELHNQSFLADTSNPMVGDINMLNYSFKDDDNINSRNESSSPKEINSGTTEQMQGENDDMTPSSQKEIQKLEETKDKQISDESILEQKMNEIVLDTDALQLEELGLKQKMSEISLNTDDLLLQAEEVAESCVATPDDIVNTCQEKILNEQINTPQIIQEETELIVVEEPPIEAKHTSEPISSTIAGATEESASLAAGDLIPENYSEDFKTKVSSAENISSTSSSSLLIKVENDQKTIEDNSTKTQEDSYVEMSELLVKPENNEIENVTPVETQLENVKDEKISVEDASMKTYVNSNIGDPTALVVDDIAIENSCDNDHNPDIAATAAVAAAAPIAVKILSSPPAPKDDDVKKAASKTTTNVPKSKLSSAPHSAAKKTTAAETTKKTTGIAAKPRVNLKSTAMPSSTDKKSGRPPLVSTATTRKLIGSSATASKVASKTATTSSANRSTTTTIPAAKTVSSRPIAATRTNISATAARKPASSTVTAAKPRPASGAVSAPAKPTTLGVSATNNVSKTKVTSPRATLTSHLRKTTPTDTKSPVKSAALNSVTKTATSTLGTRTKPATSAHGASSTTITKQFSARPAPKSTSSTSTTSTTTRRLTVGGTSTTTNTSSTTQITSKAASTTLRKSSPIKHIAGKTQTKSPNSTDVSKNKTAVKATTKSVEEKSNMSGNIDLNGTIATASVVNATEEQQQSQPHSDGSITSGINNLETQGRQGGITDHMDLISA